MYTESEVGAAIPRTWGAIGPDGKTCIIPVAGDDALR